MSSLETIDSKLDQILAKLEGAPAANVPAYDRPVLAAADAIVDGTTVNKDGSIWVMSAGFSPGGGTVQTPVQQTFGYISPKKTPEIWAFLQRSMTADDFAKWQENWLAHPYAIYGADIRDMIARGSLNIITFHMIMQPLREYPQD